MKTLPPSKKEDEVYVYYDFSWDGIGYNLPLDPITNPCEIVSEAVQLAAVMEYGHKIYQIICAKIIPSEEVQLAAVRQSYNAIGHLIKAGIIPSDAVQIAAVNQSEGVLLKLIVFSGIKPSQDVKDAHYVRWEL